jgi:tetratricopeptide (TPR) repeat protein
MAINYSLTGRYEDALAYSKRALQLSPDSADINSFYAKSEILVGNPETANRHLERFLRNESSSPMAIVTLALSYFCLGRGEQGMQCLDKVSTMKGVIFNCANFFSVSASTLIAAHQLDYALAVLHAAIDHHYVNDDTSRLLAECAMGRLSERYE